MTKAFGCPGTEQSGDTFTQHHEQGHVALSAEIFEVYDEAVEHLGQRLDGGIEFARAHAQAMPVDGGVAAAVDHA